MRWGKMPLARRLRARCVPVSLHTPASSRPPPPHLIIHPLIPPRRFVPASLPRVASSLGQGGDVGWVGEVLQFGGTAGGRRVRVGCWVRGRAVLSLRSRWGGGSRGARLRVDVAEI